MQKAHEVVTVWAVVSGMNADKTQVNLKCI